MEATMVACEVCLEEYREGELELHRDMCILRLMFRCCLCYGDYVSKEGLWNHLDLHEIADESKESHYEEIKVKHKLQQCALCNDQRAYLEKSYAKHIADVHDGFFLRCSECGEQFRSESLMNDHALSHCQASAHLLASDVNAMAEERVPSKVESVALGGELSKLSDGIHSSNAEEESNNRLNEQSHANLNTANDKERQADSSDRNLFPLQFACDMCGVVFSSLRLLLHHKVYFRSVAKQRSCVDKTLPDSEQCQKNTADEMKKSPLNQISDTRGQNKNKNFRSIVKQRSCVEKTFPDSELGLKKVTDEKEKSTVNQKRYTHGQGSCNGKMCATDRSRHHFLRYHKPLKCNLCKVSSEGLYKWSDHTVRAHAAKPKFKCGKCSKILYRVEGYERHLDRCDPEVPTCGPSSTAETSNKCIHCGIEESSADNLTRHILLHHDPVACDFCGTTLSSLSEAQIHVKTKHEETEMTCPVCSMQFVNTALLSRHISFCATHKYPCGFCGKVCKDLAAAQNHLRCPASGRNTRERMLNAEPSIGDGTSAQSSSSRSKCYYCEAEFPNFGYLSHHLKIHHKLTKCDICGVTVIGLSSVKHHKLKCHTEEGNDGFTSAHSCVFCGRRFTSLTNLERHTKRHYGLMAASRTIRVKGSGPSKQQNQNSTKAAPRTAQENTCSACKTTFSCIEDVLSHMAKCHSGKGIPDQHTKPVRHLNTPSNVKRPGNFEKQNQNTIEKTAQEKNTCFACQATFSCPEDVLIHMPKCLKRAPEQGDSQFGSPDILLLPGAKAIQTNTPQDENAALELDIKVGDTMLQDQECHHSNEGQRKSFGSSLTFTKNPSETVYLFSATTGMMELQTNKHN